jgi:ABC-type transport system substrate-binding protein
MSQTRKSMLFLFVAMMPILACGTFEQIGALASNDPISEHDIDRDRSIVLVGGQPRTLDPALTHGGPSGPIGAIFSGLVTLDTDLRIQPELAESWELSDDGTVYTFNLRPEAVFHDGRPVTAEDIIYSWERAADPQTNSDTVATYLGDVVGVNEMLAGQADHISGLRAINDHTLQVQIDEPKVYFLSKLNYPVTYIVDRENVSQPDWQKKPNGTGAFSLQEWEDDEVLILARNENYYREPADVKNVVYLMGAGIPLSMYENDEIDLVGVGGSTLERVQDPNNSLFPELRLGVDMCTTYAGFNNQEPPFNDPLVRQAFSYAIEREKLIDGLFKGNVLPATGPLPPGMSGYTGSSEAYEFDPQKAQSLLAQAGYEDPNSFPAVSFTTSGYASAGPLVTALITMWQENLGVRIEPVLIDPFTYLDELYAGDTGNIFVSGWCADYPDPENFLDVLFYSGSAQNLSAYDNPQIDALLQEARTEPDVNDRMAQYGEIEQLIVADAPVVFLSHGMSAVLVKPHLQNYVETPIGIAQWHLVEVDR